MSSLGWYLLCAAPLVVSSGYVICVLVDYFIERRRADIQMDLRTRLREFLSKRGADPGAGDERELAQLRETLELLDELCETPAGSSSVAKELFEKFA